MPELYESYALVDDNGQPYRLESADLSIQAVVNVRKLKLQISRKLNTPPEKISSHPNITLPDNPVGKTGFDPGVYWQAPNEWLLVFNNDNEELNDVDLRLDENCVVTELSSQYTIIDLDGERATALIKLSCAIDLHESTFESGQYKLTRFARLPVILHRSLVASTFRIIVNRSEARYLWDWLVDAKKRPV